MIGRIVISLFALLLLSQCREIELPEPIDQEPVFTASVSLGSDSLQLAAGDMGYLMNAGHETNSEGLTLYSATFASQECCGPQLRFVFLGVDENVPMPDQALAVGDYDYFMSMMDTFTTSYRASFESTVGNTELDVGPRSYLWDFGDGAMSTVSDPVHEYEDALPYPVKLMVNTDVFGCYASYEQQLDWASGTSGCDIDFEVRPIQQQGMFVAVEADFPVSPAGGDYIDWAWYQVDSFAFPLIVDPFQADTAVQICLNATSISQECTATVCKGVYSKMDSTLFNQIYSCEASFSYTLEIDTTIIPAPDQYGTVIIEYTTEDGTVYTTANGDQSNTPFFTVNTVEPFDDNEEGDPTRKMEVSFRGLLYDSAGQPFNDISGNATIAVSLP